MVRNQIQKAGDEPAFVRTGNWELETGNWKPATGYSRRPSRCALTQCEGQLHAHQDGDGLSLVGARTEAPLLDGDDRLLVETKCLIERAGDLDARRIDRAVGHHDRFH